MDEQEPKLTVVPVSSLSLGPVVHRTLSPELLARLGKLQAVFADLTGDTLDDWINTFRRDATDSEANLWEQMAEVFTRHATGRPLEQRKEIYDVLLLLSLGSLDINKRKLTVIARPLFNAVMADWRAIRRAAGQPEAKHLTLQRSWVKIEMTVDQSLTPDQRQYVQDHAKAVISPNHPRVFPTVEEIRAGMMPDPTYQLQCGEITLEGYPITLTNGEKAVHWCPALG